MLLFSQSKYIFEEESFSVVAVAARPRADRFVAPSLLASRRWLWSTIRFHDDRRAGDVSSCAWRRSRASHRQCLRSCSSDLAQLLQQWKHLLPVEGWRCDSSRCSAACARLPPMPHQWELSVRAVETQTSHPESCRAPRCHPVCGWVPHCSVFPCAGAQWLSNSPTCCALFWSLSAHSSAPDAAARGSVESQEREYK